MKILAIRGKNLASLEQEFEIDFTAEPLKSAGIFAITGSTGAGKSTLLDALCLALFDDTPRTNRAKESVAIPDVRDRMINQKDCRTVLRRGAGEGYAEVDFLSLGGEQFRTRWMVKRARGRADGSMQNSEIRLVNLSAGTEVQGRKTELLTKIVELIGLTFDQFSRSVLLAQGDFATFLKARQSEKAELLEKLTGTDVYSRISALIYEKTKDAESVYHHLKTRMNDIGLLPEELIVQLNAEKQDICPELERLKKEIAGVTRQIQWITEEEALQLNLRQAGEQLMICRQKMEEAKPRYDYLALIEKVQEIRDLYSEWRHTLDQSETTRTHLCGLMTESEANAQSLRQAGELVAGCELELKEFNENVEKIEPQIIQARELDVRISGVQGYLTEARKDLAETVRVREITRQAIREHRQEVEVAEQSVRDLAEWFEKHRIYEVLVPRSELIIDLLDDLETTEQQLTGNVSLLAGNKAVQEQGQAKLVMLQAEAGRLQTLQPAEVIGWRNRLREGEPCPVCGSVHHPLAAISPEQSLHEEELEKARKSVDDQITVLLTEIEGRQNEITRLGTLIENYKKHAGQMRAKAGTYLAVLPGWEDLPVPGILQKQLKDISDQWTKYATQQMLLTDRIGQLRATLEAEQKSEVGMTETVVLQEGRCATLVSESGKLQQDRVLLLKGKAVEAVVTACTEKRKDIGNRLKARTEIKNTFIARQEACKATILQMETDITRLAGRGDFLEKEIGQWMVAQQQMISREELAELFAKEVRWLQGEKQFLSQLREQETALKATVAERKRSLDRHCETERRDGNGTETRELLTSELMVMTQELERKTVRNTELEFALANQWKGEEKMKLLEKELLEKEVVAENWKKLNELFGSASGSKFKEIAQGYTLDILLVYANKHLQGLSERYQLQRIPDALALQVVDLDMLGETRAVHSLSGGESFLISLALALGLASLSSNRMSVESLFIDEGFGSLDIDTLRVAMDALECLQTQGRKIGVISHVPEMTERITARIQVLKSSNGRSEIQVVG